MKWRVTRGFTLLELLVAVTLTLGLATAMLAVTSGTLAFWRRTQDRFTTSSQAQLALDFLERDLQSIVFRPDGVSTWLAVAVTNVPGGLPERGWQLAPVMKPAHDESLRLLPATDDGRAPTIAQARFGLSGAWLRLIAMTPESAGDGALPRAIAYQLARRPVSGAPSAANAAEVRYSLYRAAVGGSASFTAGYDVATAYGSTLATAQVSDTILVNAVDFGVWLYVREDGGGLKRIYPADPGDLAHAARGGRGAVDAERGPQVADVMVRVLSDEGARQIAAIEQGLVPRPSGQATDAAWWWAVVVTHSTVHVRRVELKGVAE